MHRPMRYNAHSTVNLLHLKFSRNLRTSFFVAAPLLCLAAAATLLWLNYTGLPQSWRLAMEAELSKKGIEASISKLRYVPLRGIEATSVDIFTDPSRSKKLAHFGCLVFDLEKSKALRGKISLTHIELLDADLSIPVDPNNAAAGTLYVSGLEGKILMSGGRKFEITRARGLIGGIRLQIDGVILGYRSAPAGQEEDDSNSIYRRFIKEFLQEIDHWQLDPLRPPELVINVDADAMNLSALKARFVFDCPTISRNDATLSMIHAEGNVVNSLISVNQLVANDLRGKISASVEYDLNARSGQYDAHSSADVITLCHAFTGKKILADFSLAEVPRLDTSGRFQLPQDAPALLTCQGSVSCRNVMFRGSPVNSIETEFSYDNGDYFLRNIRVRHGSGLLTGKALEKEGNLRILVGGDIPLAIARPFYRKHKLAAAIERLQEKGIDSLTATAEISLTKDESYKLDSIMIRNIDLKHKLGKLNGEMTLVESLVAYQLESTLPPVIWEPFFKGEPLEKILADFSTQKNSDCRAKLTGSFDLKDIYNWACTGQVDTRNISYRGVPVLLASSTIDLRHDVLNFANNITDFDYSNYELRNTFNGDNHGMLQARMISYNQQTGSVTLDSIHGSAYPVPLLQMFAPRTADNIKDYRFHSPPKLLAGGVIDLKNQGATRLHISLINSDAMDWKFLGKMMTLSDLSSEIMIRSEDATLDNLSFRAFEGRCGGKVAFNFSGTKEFNADLHWSKLDLPAIASTYEFKDKGYGRLTGRIELKGATNDTTTLTGNGLCSLEKGELFAVPIFGPLSPIISGLLGDKRAGFERAKDAFCNFSVEKGVIRTNDFETKTSNTQFTGNGEFDLNNKTIDMTIRMNARGLLGIITLPLQPIIKGLFQFQGQGPMNKPNWEHVIFTSPPEEEKAALLRNVPLRAAVIEE
jgi:hypothetical protein